MGDEKRKNPITTPTITKGTPAVPAKNILILITKPESLSAAIQFLNAREWRIRTALNIHELITHIIQETPSYIMIAADHSNTKTKDLPRMIAQAFPVRVIGYTESTTTISFTNLQEMRLDYSIYPPISGPAIERTINKILKDESESFADWEERTRKMSAAAFQADNKKSGRKFDSIMVQGAQRALDESVIASYDNTKQIAKIESTENCFCIMVESDRFKGYLVAALGKNRKMDSLFIKSIESKLFDFLKSQGEKIDSEVSIEINLKQVQFEEWAIKQAEFLKKSIHNGNEVAVAFFPTMNISPAISDSKREDMASISIDDLKGDIQVLFDVYMYMPANNKYILYTPTGGMFYSKQKERLKERGITHLHMKKDCINNVKKYQAQNYLNDKIDEFNNKETNNKKSG